MYAKYLQSDIWSFDDFFQIGFLTFSPNSIFAKCCYMQSCMSKTLLGRFMPTLRYLKTLGNLNSMKFDYWDF